MICLPLYTRVGLYTYYTMMNHISHLINIYICIYEYILITSASATLTKRGGHVPARRGDMWQHVGGNCDSTPKKSSKEAEHRNVKDILKSKRKGH